MTLDPSAPHLDTLATWCDRKGCRKAPDDAIAVGMIKNPDGTTPWVHERCTRAQPPTGNDGALFG